MVYGEIIEILKSDVFDNPDFADNLSNIYEIMIDNKVEFFSPGGSFNRKIWQSLMFIMGEKTNFKKDRIPNYIISDKFRDNILPIADYVASKRESKKLTN